MASLNPLALIGHALSILSLLIIAEVIVSWAIAFRIGGVSRFHPAVRWLRSVTNPILEPLRRMVPPHRMGGVDISPMLAIVLIQVVQNALGVR